MKCIEKEFSLFEATSEKATIKMSAKRTTRAAAAAAASSGADNLIVDPDADGNAPPPAKRGRKAKRTQEMQTEKVTTYAGAESRGGNEPATPPIENQVNIAENEGMSGDWVNSTQIPRQPRILSIVPLSLIHI